MWLVLNHECTKEIICNDDIQIRVPHMKLFRQLHMGAAVSHSRASYLVVKEDGRRRGGHEDATVGRPRCVGSDCARDGGERLAGSWLTLNRASGSLPAGDGQGGGRDSPGEDGAAGSGSGGGKRRPRRRKPSTGGGPPDPTDGRSGDGPGAAVVVGTEAGDHGTGADGRKPRACGRTTNEQTFG